MSDDKPLTPQEQRFVKELASGKKNIDAIKDAGYNVTNNRSASAMASRKLSESKIQSALQNEISLHYPNLPKMVADRCVERLFGAERCRPGDELKYIQELNKVMGWYAPKKEDRRTLSIQEKWKLPEE